MEMRIVARVALPVMAMTLIAGLACAQEAPLTQEEVGVAPSWDDATKIGEQEIKARMVDPDSTRVEWPYNFSATWRKPFLGKKQFGYFTCGQVNSKNRMGGYSGRQWFTIMVENGTVTVLVIDTSDDGLVTLECEAAIKDGTVTPVSMRPAIAASPVPLHENKAVLGINYAAVPDGAYIGEVRPKSAADIAGLKPGMVISAVNGVALKGMPLEAIQGILGAVDGGITLTVIGVGEIHLRKAVMPSQ